MSAHPLIDTFNQQQRIDTRPDFKVGDTIAVIIRVIEGEKERLQTFQGVVIAIRNKGVHSSCIVRKISHGIGVERTFQLHSRQIQDIQVVRRGLVRQAKIYYMRERVGKAARIPERFPKNRNKTNTKISVEHTLQPATTPTAVEPVENTASNTTSSEQ